MNNSTLPNDRAAWIKGPEAQCSALPESFDHPWRIILLGAPGVGKGTQAQLLGARLHACHLSTGDVFRAALAAGPTTPAMESALDCMRCGQLVPDKTVLDLVRERIACLRCRGGFILDGFPRTLTQAEALEADLRQAHLSLDSVLNLTMPLEEIVTRLSGRRTCPACKAVYHLTGRPPKTEGICDQCGGTLVQREDDRAESIRVRMAAYERSTTPLTAFYTRRRKLLSIDARGTPEEISARTVTSLESRRKEAWV